MSLIDSYSLYKKDEGKKTKYNLIDHSALYEPLHKWGTRSPDIPLYLGAVPDAVNCHSQRKPALSLTGAGGQYFTGLYIPDPARPEIAFGDFGNDSILCILKGDLLEVFVCKGKKAVSPQLYSLLADGDPDLLQEMEDHRARGIGKPVRQIVEEFTPPGFVEGEPVITIEETFTPPGIAEKENGITNKGVSGDRYCPPSLVTTGG